MHHPQHFETSSQRLAVICSDSVTVTSSLSFSSCMVTSRVGFSAVLVGVQSICMDPNLVPCIALVLLKAPVSVADILVVQSSCR